MLNAIVGRATARFQEEAYETASVATPLPSTSFPNWIKGLFAAGLVLLVSSLVGLMLTPLFGNAASVTVLFGTAALGMGALWLVSKIGVSLA